MEGWLSLGDTVDTDKYFDVRIKGISLHKKGGAGDDQDAIQVERAPWSIVEEYVTVSLDNGHWAFGSQIKKPQVEAKMELQKGQKVRVTKDIQIQEDDSPDSKVTKVPKGSIGIATGEKNQVGNSTVIFKEDPDFDYGFKEDMMEIIETSMKEKIKSLIVEGKTDEEIMKLIKAELITTVDGKNQHYHGYDRETKKTTTSNFICQKEAGEEHIHDIDLGDGIALPTGEDEYSHTLMVPAIDETHREGVEELEEVDEAIDDL